MGTRSSPARRPTAVSVAVVSDTHLPRFGTRLPAALRTGLLDHRVELILHLGDFTEPVAVELLEEIAPVEGVAGNNDPPPLVARFGRRRIVTVGGARIGMVHGDAGPGRSTLERAASAFEPDEVAVVAFGHSHVARCEGRDGRWLLNPGSPTDKRRSPLFSYATLDVVDGVVTPALHYYADRAPGES